MNKLIQNQKTDLLNKMTLESLMGFLEWRQEPGVYSRVTAGMSIRNSSLFIEVRNLSRYEGQLRNVN